MQRATMNQELPEAIIVCGKVKGGTPTASGSSVDQCSACGEDIFIAPSTVKFHKQLPQAKLYCLECSKDLVNSNRDTIDFQSVPVPDSSTIN